MQRRDIAKALLASAAESTLLVKFGRAQPRAAPYYERTPAESAAGVMPVSYSHAPGAVDRYGRNTVPGTTDMSMAVQNAVKANRSVTFLNTTYLVANITITHSVVFEGQGFGTVLRDKTTAIKGTHYSQNMFTATVATDFVTFKDLTLDGACDNANPGTGDVSEISLVKITNTSKVTFSHVRLTRYCGSWSGIPRAISASFWQAITIHNADRCAFLNCNFTDNHYEMVLVWNGPNSDGQVLVDGCTERNTGRPNSHTAFDLNGGHVTVTNSTFEKTGATSNLAIQVAKSVRVANNTFLDPQPGAAAQINIGQDTFPYNTNVIVENNRCRNANSAAISCGMGSNIVIRGNIIDTPVNYGIKLTGGITNFNDFETEYPEWPAPAPQITSDIEVVDNVINGVSKSASISKGIYLHTVKPNSGWWFRNVLIKGNKVTAAAAPNDTFFGIAAHDLQDAEICDNQLQYTVNGLYFETLVQNVRIEGNTFSNVPPFAHSDIIWVGAYTSTDVKIRNNRFDNFPVGRNPTVRVFAGTVTGLEVIDNIGIHPTLPVGADAGSYVAYQAVEKPAASAPATGDWGINDVVEYEPTSGAPGEYVCTVAGSLGPAPSSTATGTAPNGFFTCSAIKQLHVGQHVSIAGAGPAAGVLACTVVYIKGSIFYVDQVISTSVREAAMRLVHPTFAKSTSPQPRK